MTDSKLWNQFAYMIFGIALFELASRIITQLEKSGDFTSIFYLFFLVLAILGLMIAVNYVLSIYVQIRKIVKQKTNSVT